MPGIKKSFTLIELVLVMVAISLVAAILIPRFGVFIGHWELTAESRKIRSHLREVQQEAIQRQANCEIIFSVGEYEIYVPAVAAGLEDTITLPNGITVQLSSAASPLTVTYDRFGAATFSDNLATGLVLQSSRVNRNITISIATATGMVKIE